MNKTTMQQQNQTPQNKEKGMKTRLNQGLTAVLFAGTALVMAPLTAMAASTAPCTPVSNTASVAYQVGGVDQTPPADATADFRVGVKVMVELINQDGDNVPLLPGNTPTVLKFKVTNQGSAVQDYALSLAGGATSQWGGADTFDVSAPKVYLDVNNNGVFDVGTDDASEITALDNVAIDGGYKTVFVVYTPSDLVAANGAIADYILQATSKWSATDAVVTFGEVTPPAGEGVCDGSMTVSVVALDVDGPGAGDTTTSDGVASADGAYVVSTANITIAKASFVEYDPINGWATDDVTQMKAIPGAIIRYYITITNAGDQDATNVAITDSLDTEITGLHLNFGYNTGTGISFKSAALTCADGEGIVVGGFCKTNSSADGDAANFGGGTGNNIVTVTGLTVPKKSGGVDGTVSVMFEATIN